MVCARKPEDGILQLQKKIRNKNENERKKNINSNQMQNQQTQQIVEGLVQETRREQQEMLWL